MIGFVATQEKAQAVNDAIAKAQTDRGLPVFWLAGMYEVFSGSYDGLYFIPCSEDTLKTPLIGNPPLTPIDFAEFTTIIESLGGLEARVSIDPSDLINPAIEDA